MRGLLWYAGVVVCLMATAQAEKHPYLAIIVLMAALWVAWFIGVRDGKHAASNTAARKTRG